MEKHEDGIYIVEVNGEREIAQWYGNWCPLGADYNPWNHPPVEIKVVAKINLNTMTITVLQ